MGSAQPLLPAPNVLHPPNGSVHKASLRAYDGEAALLHGRHRPLGRATCDSRVAQFRLNAHKGDWAANRQGPPCRFRRGVEERYEGPIAYTGDVCLRVMSVRIERYSYDPYEMGVSNTTTALGRRAACCCFRLRAISPVLVSVEVPTMANRSERIAAFFNLLTLRFRLLLAVTVWGACRFKMRTCPRAKVACLGSEFGKSTGKVRDHVRGGWL